MFLVVLLTTRHKIVFKNRQNKIVQIDVDWQIILDIFGMGIVNERKF
jgi:hypothetical protein